MLTFDSSALNSWFSLNKRLLPWRENPTPYAVWVSEIMLQQTQVNVVIPYFKRWMDRFPNLEALAESNIDEVIKLWEGLGYYSRARNLHRGAQFVCEKYNGKLPQTADKLIKIPGLGPYTVNAIRAFAFHDRAAPVDANVLRVLSRYYAIQDNIQSASTLKKLQSIAVDTMPQESPWIFAEALIELGALICKKKPICSHCPLKNSCQAFKQNLADTLPLKPKRALTTYLYRTIAVIQRDQKLLVRQIPPGQVMAGLYEFPYFETPPEGISVADLGQEIAKKLGLKATPVQKFPSLSQSFTRYQAKLDPVLLICQGKKKAPSGYLWADKKLLQELAFSSGHRRLLAVVLAKRELQL